MPRSMISVLWLLSSATWALTSAADNLDSIFDDLLGIEEMLLLEPPFNVLAAQLER
jgi:hypothetical protein